MGLVNFIERIFGAPLTKKSKGETFAHRVEGAAAPGGSEFLRFIATHNTSKSSALLGAQAIFLVVDTYVVEHGWPRTPILASLLILLAASLLVMTNLKTALWPYRPDMDISPNGLNRRIFDMVVFRIVRFNVALYLTFLSILLLGVAAVSYGF